MSPASGDDTTGLTAAPSLTAAVAIITFCRPDFVRTCLEHLAAQTRPADETLVIDASPDTRTREVVRDFPSVRYLHSDAGPGTMATSRAMALAATECDVLAFIDDDAFADADWLEHLLLPYADPAVAAVGGRARNGQPGEEREGVDRIGQLTDNGHLLGFFAADPGHDLDVDHLLGANMSVRRNVLGALGGIRDFYPGTCLREESDMFLRIGRAGHRIVYTPSAVVTHVAAPYARGRRFDLRYLYYGYRNHVVLLGLTLGPRDAVTRRYLAGVVREDLMGALPNAITALRDRHRVGAVARLRGGAGVLVRAGIAGAGTVSGAVAAARARAVVRRQAPGLGTAPHEPR